MFRSPEHALHVAYNISALPIEAKNATQLIIEMLRERFDVTYELKEIGELTPHQWHAQAAMILRRTASILEKHPIFMASIIVEFSNDEKAAKIRDRVEYAKTVQLLSNHIRPNLSSDKRFAFDYLVINMYKKTPCLRDIAEEFAIPKSTLGDWKNIYAPIVCKIRQSAVDILSAQMAECGLISLETTY